MPAAPASLSDSTLILLDCQNTYTRGALELDGVAAALDEATKLHQRARAAGIPRIHIQHDSGEGTPYDIQAEIGQIADQFGIVAPTRPRLPTEPITRCNAVKLTLTVFHRRADRDELGEVVTPLVPPNLEPHTDYSVRTKLVGLLFHPSHGQLSRAVHRLRGHGQLLVLPEPPRDLKAGVVEARPNDQSQRVEAGVRDQQELTDRQVAGEPAVAILAQALSCGRRYSGQRRRIVGRRITRRDRTRQPIAADPPVG